MVRGGYGIFFDSSEGREIDDSADIYPYSIRNNLSPGIDPTIPFKLSNQQFASFTTLAPFPASTLSFLAVIESENPINPYVQSWNLSVERELARNTTLEVNYIGTHALHLLDRRNIAQPFPIPACQPGVLPAPGRRRRLRQPRPGALHQRKPVAVYELHQVLHQQRLARLFSLQRDERQV